jgi:hypothetical protein
VNAYLPLVRAGWDLGVRPRTFVPPAPRPCRAAFTPPAGHVVANAVSEVGHVLVPDVRGEGVDRNQIELVELDRVLAIYPSVAVQNTSSPVRGSISQRYS